MAADPAAADVARTLSTHYISINKRHFASAYAVLSPRLHSTLAHWSAGLHTTRDTSVRVTRLTHAANGDLLAAVSFTSTQAPQYGGGQACTHWALDYTLIPSYGAGTPYLIDRVKTVGGGRRAC